MARKLDIIEIDTKRENSELLLISCLLQDLSLITETPLLENDFSTPKNKFYFKLVNELSSRYRDINSFTVANFLQISQGLSETFEEFGGTVEFDRIQNLGELSNFDVYLDDVVKFSLITDIENTLGVDLNRTITLKTGTKLVPSEVIASMDSSQVLDFYDMLLSSINVKSVKSNMKRESLFYSQEEIEKMESGENDDTTYFDMTLTWVDEDGNEKYHRNFPLLNKAMDGISSGNGIHIFGAFSGVGKTTMTVNIVMGLIESGEKVIFVSNEQQSKYFKNILLTYVSNYVFNCWSITRTKIKHFNLTKEEREIFYLANEFVKERYEDCLAFYSVSEFNIDKILRETKKLKLAEGFSTLVIETFKAENMEDSVGNMLGNAIALDKFGKEQDMKILLPVQLMASQSGKVSYLTSSLLASSKHIKDLASSVCLFRKVIPKELEEDNATFFLKPYVWRKDARGKMKKKYFKIIDGTNPPKRTLGSGSLEGELTLDKNKSYNLLFLDKCREASDNGVIILQELYGSNGRVRDIAYVDNVYMGNFY